MTYRCMEHPLRQDCKSRSITSGRLIHKESEELEIIFKDGYYVTR